MSDYSGLSRETPGRRSWWVVAALSFGATLALIALMIGFVVWLAIASFSLDFSL